MATSETTNLQLVKYGAGTDNFIRTDYNGNLDKIDTFAGNTNQAITTLNTHIGDLTSLTTTAKTSAVAAINEVNSKLPSGGYGNAVSQKNIAISATVTTGTFTVPVHGFYLVRYEINHIGANTITSSDPFWVVRLTASGTDVMPLNGIRSSIAIPIAKTWDSMATAWEIYDLYPNINYDGRFLNSTGAATDSGYASTLRITAFKLIAA
jgi:hypothetical protein